MGFINKLFGRSNNTEDYIKKTVKEFMDASFATVDLDDFYKDNGKKLAAVTYCFGVLHCMLEATEKDEMESLAFAISFIQDYFRTPEVDLADITQVLSEISEEDVGRYFILEGIKSLRKYLVDKDDSAVLRLNELLTEE